MRIRFRPMRCLALIMPRPLGYVSRERDLSDERKVIISLTSKGQALREEEIAMRAAFVDRLGMPYEQAVALRTTLHQLSSLIDDLAP